ncbi:MAG: hypothetical protein IH994_00385 [Proteobacteria bacterium]|nr:hypothetical protein [Pseudomonadota bacterium]
MGKVSAPRSLLIAANGFLAACVLVLVSFGVYGVTIRDVSPIWSNTILAISATLAAAFLSAFRLRASRRINLSLVVFTVAASLLLSNAWFSVERAPDRVDIAQSMGLEFDPRSIFDVVEDLRREGHNAYPALSPSLLRNDPKAEILPLGGVSRVSTVFCNESGQYVVFEADRFGFNNAPEAYGPADGRILIVGDSFAQGYCVERADSVAGNLRKEGYEALSIGMNGNGPLTELASLVEYGSVLRPKLVLWFYFHDNDLQDLMQELKHPMLRNYLQPGFRQELVDRQDAIDSFWEAYLEDAERQQDEAEESPDSWPTRLAGYGRKLHNWITLLHLRRKIGLTRFQLGMGQAELVQFEQVIGRARDLTASWGGKLIFVFLPSWMDFASQVRPRRDRVLTTIRKLGIPIIDFESVMRKSGDSMGLFPMRIYGHYTSEGYALLTRQILEEAVIPGLRQSAN